MLQNFLKWLTIWIFFAIFTVFSSCLTLPNNAFAQTNSQYSINDIIANGSGKSPAQARTNAINSGQRNAFLILLQRLNIDSTLASQFQDSDISDMISSEQVLNEKIAGNNYSATLNLAFSESFVKHYLDNKLNSKIAKINETIQSQSQLILPVKMFNKSFLLWEEDNDWKKAWENAIKNSNLTGISNILIAKGDIEDTSILSSDNLQNTKFSDIKPLLEKYHSESLVLVYFDFDSIENKANIILQDINDSNSSQTNLEFVNVNQLSYDTLLTKVANKTLDYIIKHNKENNLNQGNDKALTDSSLTIASYQINIMISGLNDWLKIKNKLENSNIVSQLKVKSISKNMAKVSVSYNKNNGEIIKFFAKNNFFLEKINDNEYALYQILPSN